MLVMADVKPNLILNVLKQQTEVVSPMCARVKRSVIDGLLDQLRFPRQRIE